MSALKDEAAVLTEVFVDKVLYPPFAHVVFVDEVLHMWITQVLVGKVLYP